MERGIRGCYVYACDPEVQRYLKKHIPSVAEAQSNLDLTIEKRIHKLTGVSVSSGGKTITDRISLRKKDLDEMIGGEKNLTSIVTIEVDGVKSFYVNGITVSVDGEYYVFSVMDSLSFE